MQHLSLFNHPDYSDLNVEGAQRYWRYDVLRAGRAVGTLAGVVNGLQFLSGFSAPFGGFEITRNRENPALIQDAVAEATAALATTGTRHWQIRAKPMAYSSNEPGIHLALNRAGWRVGRADLSFHIDLRFYPSATHYVDDLRSDARRHLKRALANDLRLRQATSPAAERTAYELLLENRTAAGRQLKLPFDYICALSARFPKRLRYFTLLRGVEPVAAALVYQVEPTCPLVIYWGHRPGSEQMSPMNGLAYHLVDRFIKEGAAILDLGTASEDGTPIESLASFKRSVLGEPTLRIDYEREA